MTHKYKVGDKVRVNTPGGPEHGVTGIVIEARMYASENSYKFTTVNGSIRHHFEKHLELAEPGVSNPQPELWTFEDARKGVRVINEDNEGITVKLNYGTEELTKAEIDQYALYMTTLDDQGNDSVLGMTIAGAKELAVGLFNHVLYLESLKSDD